MRDGVAIVNEQGERGGAALLGGGRDKKFSAKRYWAQRKSVSQILSQLGQIRLSACQMD